MHFLQILSVWQDWFAFKPDPIIKHQLELSGTSIWMMRKGHTHTRFCLTAYPKKPLIIAHSGVVWSLLHLCEKRKPWRGHAYMKAHAGSSDPSPHADVIRTIISCADQFIELIFHCGPFILFSYSVYNLNS